MNKIPFQIRLLRAYFNSVGRLIPRHSAKFLIRLFSTPRSRVIRSKEVEVIESAQSEQFEFKGEKIKLYQWGEGEKYVLLCHGWESNAGSLGAFVAPLLERGFRIISYDGPAHGGSEGKEASLITFTQVAKKIVQHYGKPEIAIGHSLGANVIMLLAYEEQIAIPKCILISPVNRIRSVFEGFKAIFKIPNAIYAKMIEIISQRTNYQLDDLLFEKIAQESPLQKVLLLHDEDDKITAVKHSKDIASVWGKATFKPIKGSGHYKILWHESTLKNAVDFLDN
ncbi:MAG: alpha/beta hydrolase [Vicingaceae bacterium]